MLARASRERADRHLAGVAAAAARQQGYRDIGAYVRGRLAAGDSLAAMSRSAGLHKDWLSRHLARLDPAAATAARAARTGLPADGLPADGLPAGGEYPGRPAAGRPDAALLRALRELGFSDVAAYLRDRHHGRHWTVNAIAAETGASHHAVAAALRRHGVAPVPHAARRHAAAQREAAVAAQWAATASAPMSRSAAPQAEPGGRCPPRRASRRPGCGGARPASPAASGPVIGSPRRERARPPQAELGR